MHRACDLRIGEDTKPAVQVPVKIPDSAGRVILRRQM